MEPELLEPPPQSTQFCLVYINVFKEGGLDSGSSDTRYRCRREQEDGRWCGKVPGRSPARLGSRDGKELLLWRRLEYDILVAFVCTLLPTVSFSFLSFLIIYVIFSCIPVSFIFFVSLRWCSSHLLLSVSTYFILRVL